MILDGKQVAQALTGELKEKAKSFARKPVLCIVRVGEDQSAISYCRGAKKRMEKCGIDCREQVFSEEIDNASFQTAFQKLNEDDQIDGIIVMRPLPKQISEEETIRNLNPEKDMDCETERCRARLYEGSGDFLPCTAEAVMLILKHYHIPIAGKHMVIIGRSLRVGKPLIHLGLSENATVTCCHSKTENLPTVAQSADILVVAIGRAGFVDSSFVKEGATVIDVGINATEDGRITGDADYESVSKVAGALTPVPGGVGAVTTSVLALQVVKAYERKHKND